MKRKALIILAVVFFVLLVSIFCGIPLGGVKQGKSKTVGERKDVLGNIVQKIVIDSSYTETYYWFTPEGPRNYRDYTYRYYLEEPGKPRNELSFLHKFLGQRDSPEFHPVRDSTLWVTTTLIKGERLGVFVFDDTHIVHQRSLNAISEPSGRKPGIDYRFENSNHTLVYRTTQGYKIYDVVTDTERGWK